MEDRGRPTHNRRCPFHCCWLLSGCRSRCADVWRYESLAWCCSRCSRSEAEEVITFFIGMYYIHKYPKCVRYEKSSKNKDMYNTATHKVEVRYRKYNKSNNPKNSVTLCNDDVYIVRFKVWMETMLRNLTATFRSTHSQWLLDMWLSHTDISLWLDWIFGS